MLRFKSDGDDEAYAAMVKASKAQARRFRDWGKRNMPHDPEYDAAFENAQKLVQQDIAAERRGRWAA